MADISELKSKISALESEAVSHRLSNTAYSLSEIKRIDIEIDYMKGQIIELSKDLDSDEKNNKDEINLRDEKPTDVEKQQNKSFEKTKSAKTLQDRFDYESTNDRLSEGLRSGMPAVSDISKKFKNK